MPVPTTIADLNVTESLNSPAGSESIGTSLDNYIRAHAAIIKQHEADLAAKTSSKGAGLSGFSHSATYSVDTVGAKLKNIVHATDDPYDAVADGSDQTAKVQLALNALGAEVGGIVYVPRGVKFNIKNLTFPKRSNLQYFIDDDTSSPGQGSDLGSNELVMFSANASTAIVNEWRETASFHPGHIVDVRKDINGHDAFLGGGQSRTEPARASYNLHDEQTDSWRVVYEHYATYSNFSQVGMHAWRRTCVLNGIGTAQWVSVPTENTVITGTTSGAKGFVLSVAAGSTTVLWFSGKFVAGETVSDNNETTAATITSVTFAITQMSPLAQGLKRGNWAVGLPANAVRDMFAVGGKIASQKTRGTFYEDEVITNPGYVWVDSYENSPPNGYEVLYDTVPAVGLRRLWLHKYDNTTQLGPIGLTRVKTAFSNSALIDTSAVNVATLTRTAVGKYTIAFTNAFPFADYSVCIGNGDIADNSRYKNVAVGSVEIWNYNSAGALADLVGQVSVTCDGGDIG